MPVSWLASGAAKVRIWQIAKVRRGICPREETDDSRLPFIPPKWGGIAALAPESAAKYRGCARRRTEAHRLRVQKSSPARLASSSEEGSGIETAAATDGLKVSPKFSSQAR
jgi:hypothetical protein